MKFEFNCTNCSTKFSMDSENLLKRVKVICPTCDIELKECVLNDLKDLANAEAKMYADIKAITQTNQEFLNADFVK